MKRSFRSYDEAGALIESWRSEGLKVVFTNGVFDLIHPGHVAYLEEAAEQGDRLIIGLNSDESVKALGKGEHRPICDQDARATVLAALRSVDAVILFNESTPLNLITKVKPNVLVKGGDYQIDDIVGATEVLENGGEVKNLSFIEGHSTTSIEQKILKAGLSKK